MSGGILVANLRPIKPKTGSSRLGHRGLGLLEQIRGLGLRERMRSVKI